MRPLMILPPLLFAGLAALFLFGMNREGGDALESTREGGVVPELTTTALADQPEFDRDVLLGDGVKLVNFWASWCAPCRAEHPQLVALADEGVAIYGINYKDEAPKALGFLDELGNPYRAVAADTEGRTGLDWGLYGVPETFVIDSDGVVVKRFAGPITEQILETIIRPAMETAAE
ncbi:DsbE family thiol:disulfide interchange protein [Maritimibacter dapengensis]|nr:DsbE family thiol:disulfide interchange protein [Maritimibacter dapengensis]